MHYFDISWRAKQGKYGDNMIVYVYVYLYLYLYKPVPWHLGVSFVNGFFIWVVHVNSMILWVSNCNVSNLGCPF